MLNFHNRIRERNNLFYLFRDNRFTCPIWFCSQVFSRKSNLKQHTNSVHAKKRAFKCSACPMKFSQKENLIRHLANKHGQGITFTCYLCKSSLGTRERLGVHMDTLHTYHPRFKCQFSMCLKSFTRKSSLNRHTNKIHTTETVLKRTKSGLSKVN